MSNGSYYVQYLKLHVPQKKGVDREAIPFAKSLTAFSISPRQAANGGCYRRILHLGVQFTDTLEHGNTLEYGIRH